MNMNIMYKLESLQALVTHIQAKQTQCTFTHMYTNSKCVQKHTNKQIHTQLHTGEDNKHTAQAFQNKTHSEVSF